MIFSETAQGASHRTLVGSHINCVGVRKCLIWNRRCVGIKYKWRLKSHLPSEGQTYFSTFPGVKYPTWIHFSSSKFVFWLNLMVSSNWPLALIGVIKIWESSVSFISKSVIEINIWRNLDSGHFHGDSNKHSSKGGSHIRVTHLVNTWDMLEWNDWSHVDTHETETLELLSVIFEFALIFFPYQKRLQSYVDPFVIRIALILWPQRDQDCSNIWTFSKPRLHSYMDPNKTNIAVIFSISVHLNVCKYVTKCFSLICVNLWSNVSLFCVSSSNQMCQSNVWSPYIKIFHAWF